MVYMVYDCIGVFSAKIVLDHCSYIIITTDSKLSWNNNSFCALAMGIF